MRWGWKRATMGKTNLEPGSRAAACSRPCSAQQLWAASLYLAWAQLHKLGSEPPPFGSDGIKSQCIQVRGVNQPGWEAWPLWKAVGPPGGAEREGNFQSSAAEPPSHPGWSFPIRQLGLSELAHPLWLQLNLYMMLLCSGFLRLCHSFWYFAACLAVQESNIV